MEFYHYQPLLDRPVRQKLADLQRNERLKHVIFAQQFSRQRLKHLGEIADMIRGLSRTEEGGIFLSQLLRHKRAMLYFTQASTRTFLSFQAACQILGMQCAEIRDPSLSSEFKGEQPLDSMRMFSSYFDIIFMRSKEPSFAECSAYLMNDLDRNQQRSVPIVNGGSGADEHPTQALLDIYTIQRSFSFSSPRDSKSSNRFDDLRRSYPSLTKGLDNKTYCFCGDIGRGRTVRSVAQLLSLFSNVKMIFVAPRHPKFALQRELRDVLLAAGVIVEEASSLRDVANQVDLVYMTRIQHEHNTPDDAKFFADLDDSLFTLNSGTMRALREYAAILHPFPRNTEIPFEIDSDHRATYFRQARNGMWSRAALTAYLFDIDTTIASHYREVFSTFHDYNQGVLGIT